MEKHRFVQQYVDRQKAYLPTYTSLLNDRPGTPSKSPRSNQFGFETPVLRPRVPGKKAPTARSRVGTQPVQGRGLPLGEAASDVRDPVVRQSNEPRPKRKKASTLDSDNERAARLADRRDRKRKKRAIVNPPQERDKEAEAPKKGRKANKPAALALLYGFSATNVTKDRLTLKPAPSLGVFSKGKASAKKKVAAKGKSASRNDLFSESVFLDKPSERVADHPTIDDDSDDSSVSSLSSHSVPRVKRATNPSKKDRHKCTETPVVKPPPHTSTRTGAESVAWDIELRSKLPSSVRDVSSEPGTRNSAPVVLDFRGAEWAASIDVAEERAEPRSKARTRSMSVARSQSRGLFMAFDSPPAVSDQLDELSTAHAVDVSSIHPSHSASRVGCRAADAQPSDLPAVASKYFTEPVPISAQEFATDPPRTSRSKYGIDALGSQLLVQAAKEAPLDGVASSINSLVSVPQPAIGLQDGYDIVPLEFSSDVFPCDDYYAHVDMPREPGGTYGGYSEPCVVETQDDRSVSGMGQHPPHVCMAQDWCRPCHPSANLTPDDVEGAPVEQFKGPYYLAEECDNPGERKSAVEPYFFETQAEERLTERWFGTAETRHGSPEYYEEGVDGSIYYSEESLQDGVDAPGFLEGRELLRSVLGQPQLSGLVQAEMDVARRLREHWRPLRL